MRLYEIFYLDSCYKKRKEFLIKNGYNHKYTEYGIKLNDFKEWINSLSYEDAYIVSDGEEFECVTFKTETDEEYQQRMALILEDERKLKEAQQIIQSIHDKLNEEQLRVLIDKYPYFKTILNNLYDKF